VALGSTKIVIAAGGTAGHVVPALAVAAALRADGAEVIWVGGERAEAQLVPAAGYELHPIAVEGLSRTSPLRAARALVRSARALVRARRLLGELRPAAVMGGGGYVSGPVGLAAVSRRIPLVLTEADSHMGLANRVLAPFARRVCLAFAVPGRTGPRYRVYGRPVPRPQGDRAAARRWLGLGDDDICVLVFGGSLGARSINQAAVEGLAGSGLRVLHVAGRRDYSELTARPSVAGYDLRDYLDGRDFDRALAGCDLVVARAGGSVFEIAAHGRAAILVPYPHASADHQTANARWMAEAGAAVVVPDDDLSGARLAREVSCLVGDRARLAAMAQASQRLARPQAARDVAGELLNAARR